MRTGLLSKTKKDYSFMSKAFKGKRHRVNKRYVRRNGLILLILFLETRDPPLKDWGFMSKPNNK